MGTNDPRGGGIFNPRARLTGFMWGTTKHCYMLSPCGFNEEDFSFHFKPIVDIDTSGCGQFGSRGI